MDSNSTGSPFGAVSLSGEYDVTRQAELRDRLLDSEDDVVVADLRDVSFLDSSAIHAFIEARNRLNSDGRDIELVNVRGMPRRVFDITGLTPIFVRDTEVAPA